MPHSICSSPHTTPDLSFGLRVSGRLRHRQAAADFSVREMRGVVVVFAHSDHPPTFSPLALFNRTAPDQLIDRSIDCASHSRLPIPSIHISFGLATLASRPHLIIYDGRAFRPNDCHRA